METFAHACWHLVGRGRGGTKYPIKAHKTLSNYKETTSLTLASDLKWFLLFLNIHIHTWLKKVYLSRKVHLHLVFQFRYLITNNIQIRKYYQWLFITLLNHLFMFLLFRVAHNCLGLWGHQACTHVVHRHTQAKKTQTLKIKIKSMFTNLKIYFYFKKKIKIRKDVVRLQFQKLKR